MMMVYEIFNENELIMNCKYFRQQIPFSVSPTLLFLQLAGQNFQESQRARVRDSIYIIEENKEIDNFH